MQSFLTKTLSRFQNVEIARGNDEGQDSVRE